MLAQYILAIAADVGPSNEFVRHCLRYMPKRFAGVLTAHGLCHKAFWRDRHQEVLLEGWRYQLMNPYEPYAAPPLQLNADWRIGNSKCLIERDLTAEDRALLLDGAGLAEKDWITALGVADATTEPNSQEYTRAMLTQLAPRSRLHESSKPLVQIAMPPIIFE